MIYSLQQLQCDVMARLGENVRSQASLSQIYLPGVDVVILQRLKGLLPIIGKSIIAEANSAELSGSESLAGVLSMKMMPCGLYAADISLPENFVRITSIKMISWKRDVVDFVKPEEDAWSRQWSEEPGIAGCPERPYAYLITDGNGLKLRAIGSKSADDSLSYLVGWQVPEVDEDGYFRFPAALYPTLIERIL